MAVDEEDVQFSINQKILEVGVREQLRGVESIQPVAIWSDDRSAGRIADLAERNGVGLSAILTRSPARAIAFRVNVDDALLVESVAREPP